MFLKVLLHVVHYCELINNEDYFVPQSRELCKMPPTEEEKWRHTLLIYEQIDLTIIEDKTQDNVYKRVEEFQADAQTLVHNIVLYYGGNFIVMSSCMHP